MGLLFALSLPLEMLPSIKLEAVLVKTPFPDASAEDVENLVSIPIEQEIRNVSGVKIVKSVSSEGLSKVVAELYPGEDITEVAREIDSRVRLITGQLPEDAEEPVAEEVRANSPLVSVSIFGDVPKDVLSGYAKEFENELILLGGIDSIASLGLHDPAFWVNLDQQKMMQFELDIEKIAAAINRKNLDFPGGAFAQGDIEFLLRTEGKIKSEQDLLNIPIAENRQGKHVLLRDVATVTLGEEKEITRSRTNGHPSVTFSIRKQKDVDIVSTVSDIRRLVEKYEGYMPEEIDIALVNDMSVRVQNRRNTMVNSGVLGFLLVLGILALFIESRAALITAIGIPISFLGALILMSLTGMTLNVLSMFGLIMMLGIIVDDALVVVENVQRHISGGMEPLRAAIEGTKEVAVPVIGTVMTNIAAFLPLFVATGLIGQFLSIIPKVAVFVLCVSLFEVLLIVPSHCADWLKPIHASRPPIGSAALFRIRRLYLRGLIFSLRNRYQVIACFAVVFFVSVFIFIRMPSVMFYFHDTEQVFVRVENPSYSSIGTAAAAVAEVEQVIVENIPPHVLKNIVSVVGTDMTDPDNVLTANHLATIIVQYEDYSSRRENALELSLQTEDKVWESVTEPKQIDFITNMGPPTGKPVDVKISGEQIPVLMSAAAEIQKFLDKQPGVNAVSSDLIYGKPEAKVEVDEAKAAVFGLDTRRIAREINVIGGGLTVAKTRIGDDEADINLRYKAGDSGVTATLNAHQMLTPLGQWISLGTVAEVTPRLTPLEIRRENARRTVGITAQIDGEVTTSREVNEKLAVFLGEMMENYPAAYSYRFA
ncbi:MAG: efflux RND transporter permease subunit, partial [Candidatus Dadabacteria bacterium]|nr:efflux RND transporter permease subunit [Candidatus Dadabacteria bacterium]